MNEDTTFNVKNRHLFPTNTAIYFTALFQSDQSKMLDKT